ncbi:MAG: Crp/Fnr family transcriptional regulator [Rhodanobacteraceae bacterium]
MTGPAQPNAKPNRLLAALEQQDRKLLDEHLEPVDLALDEVLNPPGKRLPGVYFPAGSIISLLYETEEGDASEIGIVGNEGMIGISLVLGTGRHLARSVVQGTGPAYRMDARILREEFKAGGSVQQLLLRYMQALLVQIAQTAVCNRHHTIDQQLCRWLLMSLDRVPSTHLEMTQEMMARVLGVRREGITEAAGKLQRAGAINYKRGSIEVLDRQKLESMACECYSVVRAEFGRLLPWKGS